MLIHRRCEVLVRLGLSGQGQAWLELDDRANRKVPHGLGWVRLNFILDNDGVVVLNFAGPCRTWAEVTSHLNSFPPFIFCPRLLEYSAKSSKGHAAISTYFKRIFQGASLESSKSLSTRVARSLTQCAVYCTRNTRCLSFEFAPGTGQCRLHSLIPSGADVIPNAEISLFSVSVGL